ncbi:hypothetical protein SteCoe_13528 [Stentor coeruleus]|uniref:C2H2-type domain-containing protein n=1 Tax=Stentor coeruleus TaxID=5963 RepID=A0A1R2C871_9CILI|nr:hypothetical protein SteCoe_13528 [Stentor coeruleus]
MLRTTINMADRESRPFVCEICETRFTSKQFLKRHYNVHSEERKYICEICSNTYKYRKGLNRHYRKFHYNFYATKILGTLSIKQESDIKSTQSSQKKRNQKQKPVVKTEDLGEDNFQDFNGENMDDDFTSMLIVSDSKYFQASPFPPQ